MHMHASTPVDDRVGKVNVSESYAPTEGNSMQGNRMYMAFTSVHDFVLFARTRLPPQLLWQQQQQQQLQHPCALASEPNKHATFIVWKRAASRAAGTLSNATAAHFAV